MLLNQKLLEYFCKNVRRPVSFLRQKLNKEIILDRFDFETRYFLAAPQLAHSFLIPTNCFEYFNFHKLYFSKKYVFIKKRQT